MKVAKKLLKFSQKKAVLMFQETENLKIIYIQETEAQKKVFIFQEVTFPA